MRSTDIVFSKLKSWWIIWSALAVAACWLYRATMSSPIAGAGAGLGAGAGAGLGAGISGSGVGAPDSACVNGAIPGLPTYIGAIGHSLALGGAVICLWTLARFAVGLRLGLIRPRALDLLLVVLVEAVLVLTLSHTIDALCTAVG